METSGGEEMEREEWGKEAMNSKGSVHSSFSLWLKFCWEMEERGGGGGGKQRVIHCSLS